MSDDNWLVDDRGRQASLDVGDAAARTEDREGSIMGSDSFADDRDTGGGGGEQFNLFAEEETVDGQMSLGGGQATRETEGFFTETDNSGGLFGVSETGDPEPILSTDERHFGGIDREEFYRTTDQPRGFDLSLSPEEAFDGVGATSSRSIGGFNSTVGGETDRFDREMAPPGLQTQEPDNVDIGIEQNITAAESAGVLSPGSNGDSEMAPPDLFGGGESGGGKVRTVDLARLENANAVREEYSEWVDDSDNRGRKTVRFKPETPDGVIRQAKAAADEAQAEQARSQSVSLTQSERDAIKASDGFSRKTTTATWRSAKGVLEREGLGDQFRDAIGSIADFEDPIEGAEAYVQRHKKRQSESRVGGVGARDSGEEDIVGRQRAGRAAAREQQEIEEFAIKGAKKGNQEAIEALVVEAGWDRSEAQALAGRVEDPADDMTQDRFEGIVEAEIARSRANGRFVRKPAQKDTTLDMFRQPTSGRFVGRRLDKDPEIGRRESTGRFVSTRGDR